jgi:curved DNA-binding protein CbpA
MPARPLLPPDDLYARLELPLDASPEAIEIAWRALLKRHHPDVAGAHADDVAKRINVAHDWLSDPELRDRYDRERHSRRERGRVRRDDWRPRTRPAAVRPRPRPPADPAEALERHIARVSRLTVDELDRLSLAESPPIAFVATISRFLSPERLAAVEGVEKRVAKALPASARWDALTRDAVIGYAHEIVLGPFLDEHLSEPFRERVRERLARGWEAAVDQPRYGPNTAVVAAFLERLRALPPWRRGELAVEAVRQGIGPSQPTDLPWPRGLSPVDDDALRVSSALAQRDGVVALGEPIPALARRSLARAMHGLVLRHAFRPAELSKLVGVWREVVPEQGSQVRPAMRSR